MSGFRYLLALPDGSAGDPAVFVTAVPDWRVGDTFFAVGEQMFVMYVLSAHGRA